MVDTDIAFNPLTHMGCIQKVCENQGISLAEYFQESALGIAEIIQKADKDFVAEWAANGLLPEAQCREHYAFVNALQDLLAYLRSAALAAKEFERLESGRVN